MPFVSVGVVPSVVYRMLAPGVAVDSVTLCALVYVPGEGEKVGEETISNVSSDVDPPSPPPTPPQ